LIAALLHCYLVVKTVCYRGRYVSLMVYSTAQLKPASGDAMLGGQTSSKRGWTDFATACKVIEGEMGEGPYLFGECFTAADVMIGSMFISRRMFGGKPDRPKLEAYVDRLLARPKAPKFGG
jgi:glutathione S-transferase